MVNVDKQGGNTIWRGRSYENMKAYAGKEAVIIARSGRSNTNLLTIECLKSFLSLFILVLAALPVHAQLIGPIPDRYQTLQQNSVSSLESGDNVLWIGPGLNSYSEITGEFTVPLGADSVYQASGRVFSLSVKNSTILAGIGFTSSAGGSPVNAALGYYISSDKGANWRFLPFHLDERPPEGCTAADMGPPCDIEFQYGDHTYIQSRISVPEQSPPYDVDFQGDTIFAVHWASGLLRSTDAGATWERIILPPSFNTELSPQHSYEWYSRTPDGETINRYDPRFDNNLLGFGVLIDSRNRVWTGTASGVNISSDALYETPEKISWRRIPFDPDNESGLMSGWVQKIREQPETEKIWMTNWKADPQNRDRFGIVYTEDEGESFHHFLDGVRVNDIGFYDHAIYAAADDGLYISEDNGQSWKRFRGVESPNTYIPEDARFYAITATKRGVWIGTSDGLAFSDDHGSSWSVFRTDLPLSGGNSYQADAPDSDTYAYPNPFSPSRHHEIRIKFRAEPADTPIVRIYDFGMNRVRTLHTGFAEAGGSYETVWDGTDETGRYVANGTYFYSVEMASSRTNGKILLLD